MNSPSLPNYRSRLLPAAVGAVGLVLVAGLAGSPAQADDTSGKGVRLQKVGDFTTPTYVTAPPTDKKRIFVVEKRGVVRVIHKGKLKARPFLNISSKIGSSNEQGLLSIAFHPKYKKNRRFYVNFVNKGGNTRIVEHRRKKSNANKAKSKGRVVMRIKQPESNHNGGQLQFLGNRLFIGMGDGGGGGDPLNHGQRLDSLHGALLRINPLPNGKKAYSVPASNPFVGTPGAKAAIYSYGLRNPWRFSFDRKTGDLVIADVGQSKWEEINFRKSGHGKGANFGWARYEGPEKYSNGSAPGHIKPVLSHHHNEGFCSITGGYVVRDKRVPLVGKYLYADFCDGRIRKAKLSESGATKKKFTGLSVSQPVSFGEDARGRNYVVSLAGPVYRIVKK